MPKPPPDKDRVALILSDAKVYGDVSSCEKHGISRKTLTRYQKMSESDPEVADKVAALQKALQPALVEGYQSFIVEASKTRLKLLARIEHLSELSENLHDVAGAYKIVNDGILADRAVGVLDEEDESDGGRADHGTGVEAKGRQAEEAARRAGAKLSH